MAIDGIFLGKLADELNSTLKNGRIDQVNGLNKTDYCFVVRVPGNTYTLYISVSYNNPTIFITKNKFEKPQVASSFTMFLRKHFEGTVIKEIKQLNHDRVIAIEIEQKDEIEGILKKTIIVELIGRFSNLLIVDNDNKIINAIKELSVFETNSRGIMRGLKYESLKNDKISPIDYDLIKEKFSTIDEIYPKNIVDSISGISPILANYMVDKFSLNNVPFIDVYKSTLNNYNPVLSGKNYYYFNVFDDNDAIEYSTISELLYVYYQNEAAQKILKDNNQKVYQTVSSNSKRINKKIIKLEEDLKRCENADDLRIYGELLLANINSDLPRKNIVTLYNYYTSENIDVQIDPSKSIKDNSSLYFKKYRKSKNAVEHIITQLDEANNEKEYFEQLNYQLKTASLKDLVEIKNELTDNGYIFSKEIINKKKNQRPNFLSFNFNESKIYVGKNNIQNDYLTHHFAKKDDLWFHIKDGHGSHVVVSGETKFDDEVIRFAAKLAAIHSESKDSESVPVDYTLIKNVKKVPGRKGSFVTYTKQKTIYIDPNKEG